MAACDLRLPKPALEWVVARLTNHGELARELGLPTACSDSEVVAALVERDGLVARQALLGAFAYAIREPDSGDLVITRDHLGVMPAYWAIGGDGRVHVADTLAALAMIPGVDTTADPSYATALDLNVPGLATTHSPMRGVHRVPPGAMVRITREGTSVERWWDPSAVPRVRMGIDEASRQLRQLLVEVVDDAVEACLRQTPDGVAAHLSGGLDSTSVAFIAHAALQRRERRLTCVLSWSPPPEVDVDDLLDGVELAYDERALISDLADELSTRAIFSATDPDEADWLRTESVEAIPRSSLSRESHVLPQAQQAGVRYILSGWGGDEFASFNGRMTNRAIVRELRLGAIRAAYHDLRRRGRGRIKAAYALARAGMPESWNSRTPDVRVQQRDARARAAASDCPELVAAYFDVHRSLAYAANPREVQLALLRLGHLARRIESWHEAGHRFGIDYSYPLLDVRLVEWALSMPPEVFRVGDHSRRVFRRALEGIIPDELRMTSKDDPVLLAMLRSNRARSQHRPGDEAG